MKTKKKSSIYFGLSALGVVYGDIGTSPLYAMRVALGDLPINEINVLGVLSLIFWTLIIIISIKYLILVFRVDNDGEGGILALLALLKQKNVSYEYIFYLLAIFGAGLLIGDGMLTPTISVTSAIEGLKVILPKFNTFIVPISCTILILLFLCQSFGTGKIGGAFGPLILVWFIVCACLGLNQIIINPMVWHAINPYYAYKFIFHNGFKGYFLLGGIFLVVTGGEALYADIGHFGKNAIRYSWFFCVLPALMLMYFGQGANLLLHPEAIENPFYLLAPDWFFIPLLFIATAATVIASQAVISATFSLTKQAVLLGLYPRVPIVQTSAYHYGQIYIPQMNFLLLIGALILIFTFKTTEGLAHAYGIAVNLDMLLVTTLIAYAASNFWQWPLLKVLIVFSFFIVVEIAFLGANSRKFLTGGWVPVCFAAFVAMVMLTWKNGLEYIQKNFYLQKDEISKILKQLRYKTLNHLTGVTAIFITDTYDRSGGSFLHFLKLSLAVPENILILNYAVANKPYILMKKRFEFNQLADRIWKLTLHFGFMDDLSIPNTLTALNQEKLLDFAINVNAATYFVEIPNILPTHKKTSTMFFWQEKLFAFLMRNYSANLNIEFYGLPYNRTIALGTYYIL